MPRFFLLVCLFALQSQRIALAHNSPPASTYHMSCQDQVTFDMTYWGAFYGAQLSNLTVIDREVTAIGGTNRLSPGQTITPGILTNPADGTKYSFVLDAVDTISMGPNPTGEIKLYSSKLLVETARILAQSVELTSLTCTVTRQ